VVVVGGGIAGLAAAWELVGRGVEVLLLDAADRVGGKIRTAPLDGADIDAGPDAWLARVPWATELAGEVGLGDELVHPATGGAHLWLGGRLRRLPEGLVLGVPSAAGPVVRSGLLSPVGLLRAGLDLVLPSDGPAVDEPVGALVRRRMGREVLEKLVDPLVGGINAGDADVLSLAASVPQLAAASAGSRSLALGLRAARRAAPSNPSAPAFSALPGGLERLPRAVAAAATAAGATIRTGARVVGLARSGSGWRVDVATGDGPVEAVDAAGVVLAAPGPVTGGLLGPVAPSAGATLAALPYASVALVTMALPADAVPGPLDGTGFLVPRTEGRLMTACSWASSKWAHLHRPGRVLLRVSAGRHGDDRALRMGDDELVTRLVGELGSAMGLRRAPDAVEVHRWPGAFPQYLPGHLDRVAAASAELAALGGGVAVAGAALRGVGIPACIASGRAAAAAVAAGAGLG
jgi:oxygen-dependent protoporphyrinogen oxidase